MKSSTTLALERNLRASGWEKAARAAHRALTDPAYARVDVGPELQVRFSTTAAGVPECWLLPPSPGAPMQLVATSERAVMPRDAIPRKTLPSTRAPRLEDVKARVPPGVHDWLRRQADASGSTVSEVVRRLLVQLHNVARGEL